LYFSELRSLPLQPNISSTASSHTVAEVVPVWSWIWMRTNCSYSEGWRKVYSQLLQRQIPSTLVALALHRLPLTTSRQAT
jgi:hypothetical protein